MINNKTMRMASVMLVILTVLVLAGCGSKLDTSRQGTSTGDPEPQTDTTPIEKTVKVEWLEKTTSAASPGLDTEISDEAINGLKKAREKLQGMPINEAIQSKEIFIQELDYTLVCDSLDNEAMKLKACRIGHGMNMVEAQALFWFEDDKWKVQLYPQMKAEQAKNRLEFFKSLGSNCPIGCAGGFEGMNSVGNDVLVKVNLSSVGTRGVYEAQLLRKSGEKWEAVWAPSPENYPFKGFVSVELPKEGIDKFTVVYQDGSKQEWDRNNDSYQPAV